MRSAGVGTVVCFAIVIVASGCGSGAEGGDGDWEQPEFFADVEGDVAVYGEAIDPEPGFGTSVRQEEGHWVEFCYAETGCEDRSGDDEWLHGTVEEVFIHGSDPDREVVGVKVGAKVADGAAADAALFIASGTHHPEASAGEEEFEMDERLMETDVKQPGDVVDFWIGRSE